jgi:hypothetical protein
MAPFGGKPVRARYAHPLGTNPCSAGSLEKPDPGYAGTIAPEFLSMAWVQAGPCAAGG